MMFSIFHMLAICIFSFTKMSIQIIPLVFNINLLADEPFAVVFFLFNQVVSSFSFLLYEDASCFKIIRLVCICFSCLAFGVLSKKVLPLLSCSGFPMFFSLCAKLKSFIHFESALYMMIDTDLASFFYIEVASFSCTIY